MYYTVTFDIILTSLNKSLSKSDLQTIVTDHKNDELNINFFIFYLIIFILYLFILFIIIFIIFTYTLFYRRKNANVLNIL